MCASGLGADGKKRFKEACGALGIRREAEIGGWRGGAPREGETAHLGGLGPDTTHLVMERAKVTAKLVQGLARGVRVLALDALVELARRGTGLYRAAEVVGALLAATARRLLTRGAPAARTHHRARAV